TVSRLFWRWLILGQPKPWTSSLPVSMRTLRRSYTAVDGLNVPRAELELPVKTLTGWQGGIRFVVDDGTAFTLIPISVADQLQVPYARSNEPVRVRILATSTLGHRGFVSLRIDRSEVTLPCFFVEAPELGPGRRPPKIPCLLGRAGFLDDFKVCINGLIVTIRRRRWWDRWRERVFQWWFMRV